jgi:hypothetical protein
MGRVEDDENKTRAGHWVCVCRPIACRGAWGVQFVRWYRLGTAPSSTVVVKPAP